MTDIKRDSTAFKTQRLKWKYTRAISYPAKYHKFLWDYSDGSAPLEIYLLRLLTYGNYENIRKLFSQFPQQTYEMIQRLPQIRWGVKFWIRKWYEERN